MLILLLLTVLHADANCEKSSKPWRQQVSEFFSAHAETLEPFRTKALRHVTERVHAVMGGVARSLERDTQPPRKNLVISFSRRHNQALGRWEAPEAMDIDLFEKILSVSQDIGELESADARVLAHALTDAVLAGEDVLPGLEPIPVPPGQDGSRYRRLPF